MASHTESTPLVPLKKASFKSILSGVNETKKESYQIDEKQEDDSSDGFFQKEDSRRTMGTLNGVFGPVSLAMFSGLLFLRLGKLLFITRYFG